MQKLLLFMLLIISTIQVKAQYATQLNDIDSTANNKIIYHHRYCSVNNQALQKDYLLARLKTFKSSASELSRSQIHLALSFMFLGAFAMAYIIPNPTSILFSIIGIPSCLIESAIARKHFRKSIRLYNQEMSNRKTV
ncbi:MAG TPA: hypothetical protein VN698_08240 [Bacteroidia bacterium]|nr:hypothetical protein [Bacteroidia bacterium]